MKNLSLNAPAKVNLTLEVLGKRPDGYHELKSVMQTIGLCDTLSLEPSSAIKYVCANPDWQPDKSLLPKAVNLLRECSGTDKGAIINLTKNIPLVSGLGGESSLAAAGLNGLNRLWGLDLSPPELEALAAKLGSDVPFFVRGGTALSQGRGEIITPLPPLPESQLVLLVPEVPEIPQKTARLYGCLNPGHYTKGEKTDRLVTCLKEGGQVPTDMLFNVFDEVAAEVFSGLGEYRQRFVSAGARDVHLAGAGPAMFALYDTKNEAEAAHRRLAAQGLKGYRVAASGTFA
ncbi:MAG: 4-(cytidine 5'-diphospho)-2-C-methyl-D-erythritol kinase [Dehalococcoidia bacterium]|jgi:4-diphosphocytidyl-2-C-methyl-D-erythritol kinase|nr:MAG: 4-(cytidine 5'-diphospho)-2-C-methyl-D-erythritol kinase [Dehalococcoidia bacterium]